MACIIFSLGSRRFEMSSKSTPGEIHGKILKTSSSWALKFSIDPEPLSRTKEETQPEAVQQELSEGFRRSLR